MYLLNISATHLTRRLAFALTVTLSLSSALAQTKTHTPEPKSSPPIATTPAANSAILARGPAGVIVTANDVLSELRRAPEADRQAALARPDTLGQLTKNLLLRRVLAAEAARDGLGADPVVAATLMIARDRALSDARLAQLDAQNAPTEAALDANARNVYQANSAKFEKPAQTRARHILLDNTGPDSLQKAKDMLAKLRAGASFEELAKDNSTDTGSGTRGGDLGFFAAGQMIKPFDDAVAALTNPGDLSEPVESQFGYHIIRLEERKDKSRLSYEEVRLQLMAEARTAILNESRMLKVKDMSKGFVFERDAIEALSNTSKR